MAAFNLTAELNLRGPSNLNQVVSNIRRQLSTVSLNLNINPSTSRGIQAITSDVRNLSTALRDAQTNSVALATALRGLGSSVSNLASSTSSLNSNLSNINRGAATTATAIRSAGSEMNEFGRQSALAIRRFAAFSVATGAIYTLGRAIASAYGEFINFNKEFVRLQQVTDSTATGLKSLANEITRLSTSLGVSSQELLQVSVTLAQAGLSAGETKTALEALAKSALAPSFDSLNDTVEGSIALMRQFGISANDLESSLGSVNAVAAKFAVEASDIIAAIQRTGGVFANASRGVSEGKDALNEFLAVFTSVRATTRESAETIATGLRTIFTRIQRTGTIDALKEYGIVLTDLEDKFVGPFEAVRRLSEGLKTLDPRDLRFSQIVEELGGFRQIGKVIPLIQQFATAQQALGVAQRGAGSLAADAATAQQALAVRVTKVREEFIALIRDIGQSKSFQQFADISLQLASALISVASAAKEVLPALAALAAIRAIPALGQFASGFAGGLGRRPRGFARGGLVPGSGSGDTVPAMLTPGEFVIRKKAVQAIGTDKLSRINRYASGGYVQKFARGGKPKKIDPNDFTQSISNLRLNENSILRQSAVGVAILKGPKTTLSDGRVNKSDIIKSVGSRYKDLLTTSIAAGSIKIDKEALDKDTYTVFNNGIEKGLIGSVNIAIDELRSKFPSLPTPAINDSQKSKYLKGVNDAARGNLFEEILTSMKNKGIYDDNPDPQRPFDFIGGLGDAGSMFKKLRSLFYVDAKASNPADSAIAKKIANQTLKDLGVIKGKTDKKPKANQDSLLKAIRAKYENQNSNEFKALNGSDRYVISEALRTGKVPMNRLNQLRSLLGMEKGGSISGEDTVPALLTPGEFVINKKAAKRLGASRLNQLNKADKIQGFNKGGSVGPIQSFAVGGMATAVFNVVANAFNRLAGILPNLITNLTNFGRQTQTFYGLPRTGYGTARAGGPNAGSRNFSNQGSAIPTRGSGMGSMAFMFIGPMIAEAINSAITKNLGKTGAMAGSVITSGISGAAIGSAIPGLGPWGALIGAVVGATAAFIDIKSAGNEYQKAQNELTIETESSNLDKYLQKLAAQSNITADDLNSLSSSLGQIISLSAENRRITTEEAGGGILGAIQRYLSRTIGSSIIDTIAGTNIAAQPAIDVGKLSRDILVSSQIAATSLERSITLGIEKGFSLEQVRANQATRGGSAPLSSVVEKLTEEKGKKEKSPLTDLTEFDRLLAIINRGAEITKIEAEIREAELSGNKNDPLDMQRLANLESELARKIQEGVQAQTQLINTTISTNQALVTMKSSLEVLNTQMKNLVSVISRAEAEFAESSRQRDIALSANFGQASISGPSRLNEEILRNMTAFSAQDVVNAIQKLSDQLGFSPQFAQQATTVALAQQSLETQLPALISKAALAQLGPNRDEAELQNIRDEMKALFEPLKEASGTELDEKVFIGVVDSIIDRLQSNAASLQGKSFADIVGSDDFIRGLFGSLSGTTEALITAQKSYNDMLAATSKELNVYADSIGRVTALQTRAASMQIEAANNLKKALGESVSVREANRPFEAELETLTAERDLAGNIIPGTGTADPTTIAKQLALAIEEFKDAQDKGVQADKDKNQDEVNKFAESAAKAKTRIDRLSQAQEKLASDTTRASNALARIAELRQAQESRRGTFDEILSNINNPEWMMEFVNRVDAMQRVQAGVGTMADIPAALEAFKQRLAGIDPALVEGERKAFYDQIGNILARTGVNRGLIDDVMKLIGNRGFDNETQSAIDLYNKAIGEATQANKDMIGRMTGASKVFFDEVVAAGKAFATRVGEAGQNPPQENQAPAAPPPNAGAKSKGGLIYASKGQYINFEPKGTDTVPAMLTPGEFVVNAKATKKNLGLLKAINNDKSKGYSKGGIAYLANGGRLSQAQINDILEANRARIANEDKQKALAKFLAAQEADPEGNSLDFIYNYLSDQNIGKDSDIGQFLIDQAFDAYHRRIDTGDTARMTNKDKEIAAAVSSQRARNQAKDEALVAKLAEESKKNQMPVRPPMPALTNEDIEAKYKTQELEEKLAKYATDNRYDVAANDNVGAYMRQELEAKRIPNPDEVARLREERYEANTIAYRTEQALRKEQKKAAFVSAFGRDPTSEELKKFDTKTAQQISDEGEYIRLRKSLEDIISAARSNMSVAEKDLKGRTFYESFGIGLNNWVTGGLNPAQVQIDDAKREIASARILMQKLEEERVPLSFSKRKELYQTTSRGISLLRKNDNFIQQVVQDYEDSLDTTRDVGIDTAMAVMPLGAVGRIGRVLTSGSKLAPKAALAAARSVGGGKRVAKALMVGEKVVRSGAQGAAAGLGAGLFRGSLRGLDMSDQENMSWSDAVMKIASQSIEEGKTGAIYGGIFGAGGSALGGAAGSLANKFLKTTKSGRLVAGIAKYAAQKVSGALESARSMLPKAPNAKTIEELLIRKFAKTSPEEFYARQATKESARQSKIIAQNTAIEEWLANSWMGRNMADPAINFIESIGKGPSRSADAVRKAMSGGLDLRGVRAGQSTSLPGITGAGTIESPFLVPPRAGQIASESSKPFWNMTGTMGNKARGQISSSVQPTSAATMNVAKVEQSVAPKPQILSQSNRNINPELYDENYILQPLDDLSEDPSIVIRPETSPPSMRVAEKAPIVAKKSGIISSIMKKFKGIGRKKSFGTKSIDLSQTDQVDSFFESFAAKLADTYGLDERAMYRLREDFSPTNIIFENKKAEKILDMAAKAKGRKVGRTPAAVAMKAETREIDAGTLISRKRNIDAALLQEESGHVMQAKLKQYFANREDLMDETRLSDLLRSDNPKMADQIQAYLKSGEYGRLTGGKRGYYKQKDLEKAPNELFAQLMRSVGSPEFENSPESRKLLGLFLQQVGYDVKKLAAGGVVYASKGAMVPYQPKGTDTVPAMLTPGEFVVNAKSAKKNMGLLKAINGGAKGYVKGGVVYLQEGGSVSEIEQKIQNARAEQQALKDQLLADKETFFYWALSNEGGGMTKSWGSDIYKDGQLQNPETDMPHGKAWFESNRQGRLKEGEAGYQNQQDSGYNKVNPPAMYGLTHEYLANAMGREVWDKLSANDQDAQITAAMGDFDAMWNAILSEARSADRLWWQTDMWASGESAAISKMKESQAKSDLLEQQIRAYEQQLTQAQQKQPDLDVTAATEAFKEAEKAYYEARSKIEIYPSGIVGDPSDIKKYEDAKKKRDEAAATVRNMSRQQQNNATIKPGEPKQAKPSVATQPPNKPGGTGFSSLISMLPSSVQGVINTATSFVNQTMQRQTDLQTKAQALTADVQPDYYDELTYKEYVRKLLDMKPPQPPVAPERERFVTPASYVKKDDGISRVTGLDTRDKGQRVDAATADAKNAIIAKIQELEAARQALLPKIQSGDISKDPLKTEIETLLLASNQLIADAKTKGLEQADASAYTLDNLLNQSLENKIFGAELVGQRPGKPSKLDAKDAMIVQTKEKSKDGVIVGYKTPYDQYQDSMKWYRVRVGEFNREAMLTSREEAYNAMMKSRQDAFNNRGRPQTMSSGGIVYAAKGQLIPYQPKGTDTVPAMLTPGEFVINRKAAKQNIGLLKAINNGHNVKPELFNKGGFVLPKYYADGGVGSGSSSSSGVSSIGIDTTSLDAAFSNFNSYVSSLSSVIDSFTQGASEIAGLSQAVSALGSLGLREGASLMANTATSVKEATTAFSSAMTAFNSSSEALASAIGAIPRSISLNVSGSIPVIVTVQIEGGTGSAINTTELEQSIMNKVGLAINQATQGGINIDTTIT